MRKLYPDVDISVATVAEFSMVSFTMDGELRKYGLDPSDVSYAFWGKIEQISKVSLSVIENIVQARALAANGETHLVSRKLVMPKKLINWLIGGMLEGMIETTNRIPSDLIVLIRHMTGGTDFIYERRYRTDRLMCHAISLAAAYIALGEKPTMQKIGACLGVEASTVSRWFAPGNLMSAANRMLAYMEKRNAVSDLIEFERPYIESVQTSGGGGTQSAKIRV